MDDLEVASPVSGTVAHIAVGVGADVASGDELVRIEIMKMEHPVTAPTAGRVTRVDAEVGARIDEGAPLVTITPTAPPTADGTPRPADAIDLDTVRPDLQELFDRRQLLTDEARPDATARRHERGHRTVRENVAALADPGSFSEYRGLAIAAQRNRKSVEELQRDTPADGLVTGIATVNADLFGAEAARCAVLAYDYTVLAGTQGQVNHRKKDRMFRLAAEHHLPVVLFAEGGGGRPGDTDMLGASWLDAEAFHLYARLSGLVPLVAIVHGRCFAGNAALAGCADVIIATEDANLGMAGPAMIAGGGLGTHAPEAIGPIDVQRANGVVDVVVADEAAAAAAARRYLSYFQGRLPDWDHADQRHLRSAVPENRKQTYDVRRVVDGLFDTDSVLELRRDFAPGMVTALARLAGNPVGVVANDPTHLGGAIDADGADAAARFMQLCDAHGLPLIVLCDTPGFMVGPDAEHQAGVRHFSRMFVTGANLTVPVVAVVLRKAYGLGAQAMLGGHLDVPAATLAWPTAELGPMGLEGAVRLGFRRELDAIEDPVARQETEQGMIALAYANAGALNVASFGEIDDVIDPAETRERVLAVLRAAPVVPDRPGKRRPHVDAW